MTIRIQSQDEDVWVIAPRGRVDFPAARAMEDEINELCDAGRPRIVVDLSGVAYVASAGLNALLTGARRARMLNGDVRLAGLNARVRDVFEISGFDQVFAILPTTAEAIQSYKSGDSPAPTK